jgi:HEAT repeat protein
MRCAVTGAIFLLVVGPNFAQDAKTSSKEQEASLIAVLKSNAPLKEKEDACRELAIKGTKDSVAPLAALLEDEKLTHMARYGLEPIPDPAVDDALREALGKLKGRPLVGVIGSIGVRRDVKAVEPLTGLLRDSSPEIVQGTARALGRIGDPAAAQALSGALETAKRANHPAIYEGLFRCAEAMSAAGEKDKALAIYDRLSSPKVPAQVRDGAASKAKLLRQAEGPRL